jgi:hypothetical protein
VANLEGVAKQRCIGVGGGFYHRFPDINNGSKHKFFAEPVL